MSFSLFSRDTETLTVQHSIISPSPVPLRLSNSQPLRLSDSQAAPSHASRTPTQPSTTPTQPEPHLPPVTVNNNIPIPPKL
ncbi:hypothetical protein SERLA73DRAFT_192218 [Serpula lacrymans var. lacrymans S7.3]|uniref:Uncharacterized protein n=2 Tax=Serpula lacrymans var. lacrymans TaxID=341189 RepID=F8QJC1_SERL3|nr:uncharacterized protein SERLADRAFT_462246 [Serpula lacrymans var. lacrymans S7.9]EGN91599.1 hypothetical protein SERLA73DRAFT_192218 [Serpula lacrymans var. lacrymans S7.3]EGO27940.1 hypothetical protein SERLADRAFT_462246 [Serpula lacrymans var. lacrymans S7.9]